MRDAGNTSALIVLCALFLACSGSSKTTGFGSPGSGDNNANGNGADAGVGTFAEGGATTAPTSAGPCDSSLAVGDSDAASFAKAIGICNTAATDGLGVVSASYSRGFGSSTPPTTGQWGLLPKFGSVIKPREGAVMGVLSSGYAREYDDLGGGNTDFVDGNPLDGTNYPTGQAPPGFPKAASGCLQDGLVNDMIDLKLVLKAPPDANGFQFDFDFYSSEWPNYVCSNYNDAFIAYLTSKGTTDNISFDAKNNPVAVNNGFFDRCTPNTPVGCLSASHGIPGSPVGTSACAAGSTELGGTGFGDSAPTLCFFSGNPPATVGGATGWLTTKATITPGEQFTLEFMIWDAGDGVLDSSVLIDHFQWLGGAVSPGTTRVQ